MKKTYLIFSTIILVLVIIIILLLNNNLKGDFQDLTLPTNNNDEHILFYLSQGNLDDIYETQGIIAGTNYLKTETYNIDMLDYTIVAEINTDFLKDDVLFVIDGIDLLAICNGRVISISATNETITFSYINYDVLFIETYILEEDLNTINLTSSVSIIKNNNEFEGNISEIDYIVYDGQIKIKISGTFFLLYGSQVDIEITKKTYENKILVKTDFLNVDPQGNYYLDRVVQENGENVYVKTPIEIIYLGKEYTAITIDNELRDDLYAKTVD